MALMHSSTLHAKITTTGHQEDLDKNMKIENKNMKIENKRNRAKERPIMPA